MRFFSANVENPLSREYVLNDGTIMPSVGLGCAKIEEKDAFVSAILNSGYIHLDTAPIYQNEQLIGEAIQEAYRQGKTRKDFYVATKLTHGGYNKPGAALKRTLKKLQLDYVDMYLVHWPASYYGKKPLHKLWPEMESLVGDGVTRSIGVSNFNTQLIWDLLSYAKIPPACNQIELNPMCVQPELVRFLLAKNIRPVAYSPLGLPGSEFGSHSGHFTKQTWPDLRKNPSLIELGQKYGKSECQIMLNWGLCKGHVVIPKSASTSRQAQNMDVFDFRLTAKEIERVDEIDKTIRGCNKLTFFEGFDHFA